MRGERRQNVVDAEVWGVIKHRIMGQHHVLLPRIPLSLALGRVERHLGVARSVDHAKSRLLRVVVCVYEPPDLVLLEVAAHALHGIPV